MPHMKTGTTKLSCLAAICLSFALSSNLVAQSAQPGPGDGHCSNHTLFGDYGALIEGTLLAPNWPLRTLAMIRFDGNGAFTYVHYRVVNGIPVTPDWVRDSGTYSVNTDCTATAVFDGPIPVHLVITNNGKDFRGVVDGNAITLVGSKVQH
jgi:hypothetical protein